jgi:penicillin-binding protein 1A
VLNRMLSLLPRLAVALAIPLAFLVGLAGLNIYDDYRAGLPEVPDLANYNPPSISRIVAADGTIMGEFFEQRRVVIPYERMPRRLVQAFVAAEDRNFFAHDGVDLKGVVRAGLVNLRAGRVRQGASTITQQLAKQLLIRHQGYAKGSARGLARKVREAVLARRIEHKLGKEEILYLYLNEIYLGHGAYGVQAAAEAYFGKNVEQLTTGEMAILAGLPPAPSRFSPIKNPKAARNKQRHVLSAMLEEGYIEVAEAKTARAERAEEHIHPRENLFRDIAPFFTEHARRVIAERFGDDVLNVGGWRIETTLDVSAQRAARAALTGGLDRLDRRMGYWGPLARFAKHEVDKVAGAYERGALKGQRPDEGEEHLAVVEKVSRAWASLRVGAYRFPLALSDHKWMRTARPDARSLDDWPRDLGQQLAAGDVVRVKLVNTKGRIRAHIVQDPRVEGALVSQDLRTDYVVAMVGGYDFDRSQFNRAFQACRQPGSAFKPIIYSAGLELGGRIRRGTPVETITPSTLLSDTPIVRHDFKTGVRWKPSNYDRSFSHDVPLRSALMRSMNLPTVDLFERVGAKKVVAWAKQLGIKQDLHVDASIALGSHCVVPWELIQVYAVFGRGGRGPKSRFITKITSSDGEVLLDNADYRDLWASRAERIDRLVRDAEAPLQQLVSPAHAYQMTYLLRQVVEQGTATRARLDGVQVAGKTGTTNDAHDVWFVGYTPHLVTGVWAGFDNNDRPIGRNESGGRTAAPIWRNFMKAMLTGVDPGRFEVPAGIEFADINPRTGNPGGSVRVPFIRGTVPKASRGGRRERHQVPGVSEEL